MARKAAVAPVTETEAGAPRILSGSTIIPSPSGNHTVLYEGDELPEELADLVGEHLLVPQKKAPAKPADGADGGGKGASPATPPAA
jgi:hypothetical protein